MFRGIVIDTILLIILIGVIISFLNIYKYGPAWIGSTAAEIQQAYDSTMKM